MRSAAALATRDFGIRVWRRGDDGAEVALDLAEAATVRFEDGLPYRRLASYKGQRNFVGLWWFETTGAHVPYESWVERDHVMLMDRARGVVAVRSQPFCLELDLDGRPYRHTPDFFVRRSDGRCRVVDVRPDGRVKAADAAVFTATSEVCALVGWDYERVGEIDPVIRAQVAWLAAYRHPRCGLLGVPWPRLRAVIAEHPGGVPLREVGEVAGCASVAVLPQVYHRLWRGDLVCDESARWSLDMMISVGESR